MCLTPSVPNEMLEQTRTIILMETREVVFYSTLSDRNIVKSLLAKHYRKAKLKHRAVPIDLIATTLLKMKQNRDKKTKILHFLIETAIARGMSDIHLFSNKQVYFAQGRYLGDLEIFHSGSIDEYNSLIATLKEASSIDTADHKHPGDGEFSHNYNGVNVDFRVATLPGLGGNTATLRILDPSNMVSKIESLGITEVGEWQKICSRPDGIIFIVGQTGSGKTTTLNTTIRVLSRLDRKILTVENPVEYKIPFVTQLQVNELDNFLFADALKAFLRNDPNIIVVGEVRDPETASVAVRGADSAHTVLGTLHCQTISSVKSRLAEIGVSMTNLRSSLRGVLAQKLIKVACPVCSGAKCIECGDLGYIDRTVVSECVYIKDEDDFDRLMNGETWWVDILDDAIGKVLSNVTTKECVISAFGEPAKMLFEELENGDLARRQHIIVHAAKSIPLREAVQKLLLEGASLKQIKEVHGEVGIYLALNDLNTDYTKKISGGVLLDAKI